MTEDLFKTKAPTYESNPDRVTNVDNIARAIQERLTLQPTMHIMDFGSGTGLLLERLAPSVQKITAVDVSESMNAQLSQKLHSLPCEVELQAIDLTTASIQQQFDGIVSSMTMHHIQDVQALLAKMHGLLVPQGFLAIADLDLEDGSFHTEDTGVFHHGFDRKAMVKMAIKAGFQNVQTSTASTISKAQGNFDVFLLTANR